MSCYYKSKIDNLIKYCALFIYKNNNNNIEFKDLRNKYLDNKYDNNYGNFKREDILGENHRRSIKNKLENEYYFYLIYSYQENKNKCKTFLIDDELNDLDYFAYRKIDDRNWWVIYFSIFKSEYNFLKIFSFLKENY